jgi:hypothetical protein
MRLLPLACTADAEDLRAIWRRDLAINVALGGLWTPVAKRHALRFLLERTTVDGTPVQVVDARRSRWRVVILLAVVVVLRAAGDFGQGPPTPLVTAVVVAFIPFVWRTMVARHVESVRWRELQPRFVATWPQVYAASWPMLVLGAAWAAAEPHVSAAAAASGGVVTPAWIVGAFAVVALAMPLLVRQQFEWERLRWCGTAVGGEHLQWTGRFGAYLRTWATTAAAVFVCAALPLMALRYLLFGSLTVASLDAAPATVATLAGAVLAWLLSTPARAWHEAHLFILRWDGLRVGSQFRLQCRLDVRAFVALRTRQVWRTLATCGRSRPQALVELYRMKLAALRVEAAA